MLRALLLGSAATVALSGGLQAAELIYAPTTPEPIYEAGGFDWSGPYAGIMAGGVFSSGSDTNTALGAFMGYNYVVADPILLGFEFSYSYDWRDGFHGTKILASGRLGAIVTDSVLVYGLGGIGLWANSNPDQGYVYNIGAGVELAVTDWISVRGEVVGIGAFDDGNSNALDWTRATAGVVFHF